MIIFELSMQNFFGVYFMLACENTKLCFKKVVLFTVLIKAY